MRFSALAYSIAASLHREKRNEINGGNLINPPKIALTSSSPSNQKAVIPERRGREEFRSLYNQASDRPSCWTLTSQSKTGRERERREQEAVG